MGRKEGPGSSQRGQGAPRKPVAYTGVAAVPSACPGGHVRAGLAFHLCPQC